MSYLSKKTVLKAYEILSEIDSDKKQGLTQKVSALKYGAALDMYYKRHSDNCDLKISNKKDEFSSYVGKVIKLNDESCTKDFYTNIAPNGRDFDCGSNFYSQSSVKDSKTNTTETFLYPKRSGWKPVMDVLNQVLIYKPEYIREYVPAYLNSPKLRLAFIVWLLRFQNIETEDINGLRQALSDICSITYCDAIFDNSEIFNTSYVEFTSKVSSLIKEDFLSIFSSESSKNAQSEYSPSLQTIFYGAPGTGKSHRIKEQLKGVSKENIFRTTFHPDSDYSTFVGAYKPTKGKKPLYGLNGGLTVRLNDGKDLSEDIITYKFIPQTFLNAYMQAYRKPDEKVYLIIEEINRGNCAQIFGDLFQLLDRDENGVSEYTIKADADLKAFLEEEMGEDSDAIKDGELCLPSNLYIYATMNTSDQSLFPIDSAFKRRWDWEYEPIKYKNTDWRIVIDGTEYSWVSFQRKVNEKILSATSSEDKMLGDYFVNPSNGIITDKVLLNKILFYLWNDVCKDGEGEIFKVSETEDVSFSELYGDGGKLRLIAMMDYLGVVRTKGNEEDTDEEGDDSTDNTRYSINGEDFNENGKTWGKGALVKRAVEIYCQNNPTLSASQVRDNWMSVGFRIQHIVETEEDKQKRLNGSKDKTGRERCKQIILSNGESVYVSTEVGSDKVYNVFEDFLSKIQSKPEWGIKIQKL